MRTLFDGLTDSIERSDLRIAMSVEICNVTDSYVILMRYKDKNLLKRIPIIHVQNSLVPYAMGFNFGRKMIKELL